MMLPLLSWPRLVLPSLGLGVAWCHRLVLASHGIDIAWYGIAVALCCRLVLLLLVVLLAISITGAICRLRCGQFVER